MSDNLPAPAPAAAPVPAATDRPVGVFERAVDAAADAIHYTVMLARLASAALALRGVGNRVRSTYAYIGDCAKTVDHLADLAASLRPAVDPDTLAEHRQAAAIMRGSLARARQMADTVDGMSTTFDQAKAAHEADYGPVAEAKQAMPVDMANRNFYRNR